ncbi:MAG: hypothetical protein QXI12_11475 [Candidatus Methanomethyliaceae archaeon]
MTKWVFFINGRAYDPAKTTLPPELQGSAMCRYVEDDEYELLIDSTFAVDKSATLCCIG